MKRRFLTFTCAVSITLVTAGAVFAQDPKPTDVPTTPTTPAPTTPTTVEPATPTTAAPTTPVAPATTVAPTTTATVTQTTTVQNPDDSWTVIEYPVDKEVVVDLTPTTVIPSAAGTARVKRIGSNTSINLDLKGLTGDLTSFNLYAVDPVGKVTLLGPVTTTNGLATVTTSTPLNRFMLFLSPDANVTTIAPETRVVLRSAVPSGYAIVPLASSGDRDGAAVGENVSATTTAGTSPAYSAPLLGIPGFQRGEDTEIKIDFLGAMTGSRANLIVMPRKDGPTTIRMRFHEMKDSPAGKVMVLWAVSPENKLIRLGQVVNTGKRNEAEIKTESSLSDFGLFVTLEDAGSVHGTGEGSTPTGEVVGTILK